MPVAEKKEICCPELIMKREYAENMLPNVDRS